MLNKEEFVHTLAQASENLYKAVKAMDDLDTDLHHIGEYVKGDNDLSEDMAERLRELMKLRKVVVEVFAHEGVSGIIDDIGEELTEEWKLDEEYEDYEEEDED